MLLAANTAYLQIKSVVYETVANTYLFYCGPKGQDLYKENILEMITFPGIPEIDSNFFNLNRITSSSSSFTSSSSSYSFLLVPSQP